jgi:hypothetical protein
LANDSDENSRDGLLEKKAKQKRKKRQLREISAENSTGNAVDIAINEYHNFVQSSDGFKKDFDVLSFWVFYFFYFLKKYIF